MAYKAVAHKRGDTVAIAVDDLIPGERIQAHVLDESPPIAVTVREAVPLGHKLALFDVAEGDDIIEYGERIGRATRTITAGTHVHVHNIKSVRWSA